MIAAMVTIKAMVAVLWRCALRSQMGKEVAQEGTKVLFRW